MTVCVKECPLESSDVEANDFCKVNKFIDKCSGSITMEVSGVSYTTNPTFYATEQYYGRACIPASTSGAAG